MPLITKPYNYNNGQTIDANQLDQNLDALYNLVNGALDAVNIATNGINDPTKLAAETVTQAKTKGVIYSQDLYSQSWVVSGGITTASGSPANQITVTTLIANILQADGSYRHVSVTGTTYVTGIINATYYLELQPDGTMNWSQTHSVQSAYMPIATVTSDASGNILVITDNRITDPKLKGTLNNTIYSLEREVANLKAASSIANRVDGASGTFYDLNDGLNGGSAGKIDNTKTNITGTIPISAGTIVVPVLATTGFTVGQEVTIFDDVNLERRIITAINAGVSLSFAAMTNSYKIQAQICRSSVIQDTVNHLLKFNGWTHLGITFTTNTAVNVVAASYDTSGNNGDKLVQTANGWLIAIEVNGTTIQVQKSPDGGTTWAALCNITGAQVGAAIAWNGGNNVTILWNTTTIVYSNTFDVTTVTNTDQNANKVIADNGCTSIANNMSIKTGSDGIPQGSWSGITAALPNSKNIRYSKATTNSVTAWAAPTQITASNTAGTDYTNPCIVVKSNNNPVLIWQSSLSTALAIIITYWTGSAWSASNYVYNAGSTYSQQNPCARVAPSGRIWCTWCGKDATDTTYYNIRYSYSDDGGVTWSAMVKLTNGNVYGQFFPVLSIDKNNNVYILWQGQDAASPTYYNIFRNIWTGSAFQGVSKLTTNTTNVASDPSSIDSNTMDFNLLTPPMVYHDQQATAVKFSGTYIATTTTPVLVEDVRYNINPPANVSSAVVWVDHDADANYSIAGAVSFQASGGNESFANMTKTTAAIDGTHNEDQFTGSGTAAAKATLRLTLTRNSTSLVKNIESIMGAVGA